MCNLLKYRELVKQLSDQDSSEVFPNSSTDHASIVFMTFLDQAKEEMCVLDKALDGEISGKNEEEFFSLLDTFVRTKRRNLKMIVKEVVDESTRIYKTLLAYHNAGFENVMIHQTTSAKLIEYNRMFEKLNNFAIVDKKAFRIDASYLDQDDSGSSKNQALCSFNSPKIALEYLSLFDGIFNELPSLFPN